MSSPREPPPVNSTSAAAAPPCCQLTAGTELQPLVPQHLMPAYELFLLLLKQLAEAFLY